MYSLFVRGFGIKRFLQVVFFSVCGFTVCVREFLQVLCFQNLGVRALLWILFFMCVRGFLRVRSFSLRFGYQMILRFS